MRRFVVLTGFVAALSIVIIDAQPGPEAIHIQKVKDSLYIVKVAR